MACVIAIIKVLQGKPPLICLDKVEDRRLKQLRATPTINLNAFQAVWTLNEGRVLLDNKVKADIILELRQVPFRYLPFAARLAHLVQKICASVIFSKKLGKLRALHGIILRDNSVRNQSVNFLWEEKLRDPKLPSLAGSVSERRCGGDKWRHGHWRGQLTG